MFQMSSHNKMVVKSSKQKKTGPSNSQKIAMFKKKMFLNLHNPIETLTVGNTALISLSFTG